MMVSYFLSLLARYVRYILHATIKIKSLRDTGIDFNIYLPTYRYGVRLRMGLSYVNICTHFTRQYLKHYFDNFTVLG